MTITFGRNLDQRRHTFRHVFDAGLYEDEVTALVVFDLESSAEHFVQGLTRRQITARGCCLNTARSSFKTEGSMSGGSQSSRPPRALSSEEQSLMGHLLKSRPSLLASLEGVLVTEMADGGMESLNFGSPGGRRMSSVVAEAKAVDLDQVPVVISVNVDEDGELFELDIWKVDYSPLQHVPQPAELEGV